MQYDIHFQCVYCSLRQQAPMVFSLHLVYLSTAACISEKNKFGSMLAQGFLRVKGQAQITKCYFL